MDRLRRWLNDARIRSALAGGIGGFAGWLAAELLIGFPFLLWHTVLWGLLCGVGIAVSLGVAEGAIIGSWSLLRRGLLAGVVIGALGGAIGAVSGQATFSLASAGNQGSVIAPTFSKEIQDVVDKHGGHKGELEIVLAWHNTNDLDLHVVDPSEEEIFFGHTRARSGGWLDIDANANCQSVMEPFPVEHVRWSEGSAPAGKYLVAVHHYRGNHPDPTEYTVEVKKGADVQTFTGSISYGDPIKLVHQFTWQPPTGQRVQGPGLVNYLAIVLGWTIFGAMVGVAEGGKRRSLIAMRNSGLGGTIGGALGGLAIVGVTVALATSAFDGAAANVGASHAGWPGRFLGYVILGACIGLWIILIERALAAILAVRSGRYEGREIYLEKQEVRLGRNDALDVYLGGDPGIAPHHATIRRDGKGHVLLAAEGLVSVNGTNITSHLLRDGDTLVLGNTRMVYKRKAATSEGTPGLGAQSQTSQSLSAAQRAAPRSPRPPPPPPPPPPKKKASLPPVGEVSGPAASSGGTPKAASSEPKPSKAASQGPPPPPPKKRR